jgi:RNA polymerase sigma factor (sigma-70 family)
MAFDYAPVSTEKRSVANNVELEPRLHGLEENGLAAAAKRGQTAAFGELCRLHAKRILRTTYRITKNREDAEDALQDSFLRAFVHIQDFDARSSFSTWLTRIAINSALMIVRKKRSAPELSIDHAADHGGNPGFVNVPDPAPNPEAYCAQREREGILRDAICALRPTIRQAVEFQKLQEHSLQDTAKMMGLSVTAAKSRLYHAKAALRESLREKAIRHARGTGRFDALPAA